MLKPSLLIISLGTNESFGRNFSKEQFRSQANAFIRLVKEELPGTALLMTTPAESYRRMYKNKKRYYVRNDNIAKVADALINCTKENRIACWDLFSITGGENSCKNWLEAGLFGRDRIHFSQKGYGEQGALLYKALIRSCIHSCLFSTGTEAPAQVPKLRYIHASNEEPSLTERAVMETDVQQSDCENETCGGNVR